MEEDPVTISVKSFVAARAEEIIALSAQIGASSSVTSNKGLVFQHVPKHMRRRAVSHNVKRLPKRLRAGHLNQLDKSGSGNGVQKKPKKPSRKHRRRKSNLLLEYNRRQRSVKWTETHIWHAKRFHMEAKWNWKIPISPCDKGYRAIYRAFRHHCAMRDISFLSCLEIIGPAQLICQTFKLFSSPLVNKLSIAALFFTTGEREGSLHFYKKSTYPYGFIGRVKFSWCHYSADGLSKLWLWTHPGFKSEVLEELIGAFELLPHTQTKTAGSDPTSMETEALPSIDAIKLTPKHLDQMPTWTHEHSGISITDLEGGLNRIRLYGPESTAVLKEVLRTKKPVMSNKGRWANIYYEGNKADILVQQDKLWSEVTSFQDFPAHLILPLTVRDPRIFLPEKRQKSVANKSELNEQFPDVLQKFMKNIESPLYFSEWRDRATQEKLTDLELSKRRGQLLIPGSDLDLGEDENQVPVVLIQQPDAGWDLILPAGWTMAFWIAFSYRNVRAFGERDAVHYAFEFGSIHSPELPSPDSAFGQQELESTGKSVKETYFALPPDKRHNLIQLKCPFAFKIDWTILLKYWCSRKSLSDSTSDFYILRDTSLLHKLNQIVQHRCKVPINSIEFENSSTCLVGVRVTIVGKGKPEPNSLIYIPDAEDIQEYKIKSKSTMQLELDYSEPPKDFRDINAKKDELRQKHQKYMAFLRKKRKKLRKRGEADESYDSKLDSYCYNEEMKNLCVPSSLETLGEQSRTPIGFVTIGGDCYSIGKCSGLGYVTLLGILEYVQSGNPRQLVLLRDSKSTLIYRLAKLEICEM